MEISQIRIQPIIPLPLNEWGKYTPNLNVSLSTHLYDELVGKWIGIDSQKKNTYASRLSEIAVISQFIDELDPLRLQTRLREVNRMDLPMSYREGTERKFVKTNLPILQRTSTTSDFENLAVWFRECYDRNADGSKEMLQNLFNTYLNSDKHCDNIEIRAIVNLLRLLRDFDYEEMEPIGLMMVSSAISLNNDKVRSEAVNVLSHWSNKESYNLFMKLTPPTGFLYKIQYNAVKKSFEQKYGLHAQDRK